ncbi:unnamed protein product [Mycena citricolor]|uniref:Fungal-type protein kinase domain-containing protein n=1 Tax=Mycena citricolor TaxID=2018698 RepID=A0AAD2H589_9AGAR|nr:unnamed protein product [Mycena citricolor]
MFPVLAFLTPLLFGAAASGQGVATNATCNAASLQWVRWSESDSRVASADCTSPPIDSSRLSILVCRVRVWLQRTSGEYAIMDVRARSVSFQKTGSSSCILLLSSVHRSGLRTKSRIPWPNCCPGEPMHLQLGHVLGSECVCWMPRPRCIALVCRWSIFSQNCTTTYISRFPEAIPSNTAVPHWAYQNVTIFDGFNATAAQTQLNAPESTAGGQATSTGIPSGLPSSHPIEPVSGGKKANAGAIAGGVVGGVVGAALIFVVAFLLVRRRKHSDPPSRLVTSAPVSMSYAGDHITPFTGGLPAAKLYNPDDPSTFPSSIVKPLSSFSGALWRTYKKRVAADNLRASPASFEAGDHDERHGTAAESDVEIDSDDDDPAATRAANFNEKNSHTPRKCLPSNHTMYNSAELNKQDSPIALHDWMEMVEDSAHNHGIEPVEEFLANLMGPGGPTKESAVKRATTKAVQAGAAGLEKAKELYASPKFVSARQGQKKKRYEADMEGPIRDYLAGVVSSFSESKRPEVAVTARKTFTSVDKCHVTRPDISLGKPGLKINEQEWKWSNTLVTVQLKFHDRIHEDDGTLGTSDSALHALVQLAKDARHLMMSSDRCFVFVVAISFDTATLFRFDTEGFFTSKPFNWLENPRYLPEFLYRIYHPSAGHPQATLGEDDTITFTDKATKRRIWAALETEGDHVAAFKDEETAVGRSFCLTAAVFGEVDGERVLVPVKCHTIGEPLWHSHGLFGRATKVFRVMIDKDLEAYEQSLGGDDPLPCPQLYALKDSWRQGCRRPEVDYYDLIELFRKSEKGQAFIKQHKLDESAMARCIGSLDLSDTVKDFRFKDGTGPDWDTARHKTTSEAGDGLHRYHTRTLLTPVGTRLDRFTSTWALVTAVYHAACHLFIAFEAGVLHRDVSEGNIMFAEMIGLKTPRGFLVDWDYAEFTEKGLEAFKKNFGSRLHSEQYDSVDKSLKHITGTWPFLAIEVMQHSLGQRKNFKHGSHHDLESLFWLLYWMGVRHTKHHLPAGDRACTELFDSRAPETKKGTIADTAKFSLDGRNGFHVIVNFIRRDVFQQNLEPQPEIDHKSDNLTMIRRLMTHEATLKDFRVALDRLTYNWHENDGALQVVVNNASQHQSKSGSKKSGSRSRPNNSSLKRRRAEDEDDGCIGPADARPSSSKKRKPSVGPEEPVPPNLPTKKTNSARRRGRSSKPASQSSTGTRRSTRLNGTTSK